MKYGASGNVGGIVARVIKEQVGAKGTDKVTVAIMTTEPGDKYPSVVPVVGFGKAAPLFDGVAVGMEVVCEVEIRGREWQGKYFPEVRVLDCNIIGTDQASPAGKSLVDTADDSGMPF